MNSSTFSKNWQYPLIPSSTILSAPHAIGAALYGSSCAVGSITPEISRSPCKVPAQLADVKVKQGNNWESLRRSNNNFSLPSIRECDVDASHVATDCSFV
jgi:hypothetical protein